ncbi:MAG: hypothetical protein WBD18_01700 [Phycisphaerae bacterium]
MRAKRTWLGLALAILAALAVGGLVAPSGGADEYKLKEVKDGEVTQQGEIDHPGEEEPVSPESVTTVGDNIKVVSKTLTPPDDMDFKEFPSPNPWHFVDIETDPEAPPGSADTDTASAIKVSVEEVPETAGAWPLKGEGNLQPPAGGPGTSPHWSAKVAKAKLTLTVENNLTECMEGRYCTYTATITGSFPQSGVIWFVFHYTRADGTTWQDEDWSYDLVEDNTAVADQVLEDDPDHKFTTPIWAEAKNSGVTAVSNTLNIDVYELWIEYFRDDATGKDWKTCVGEAIAHSAIASDDCQNWEWDMADGVPDAWNPEGASIDDQSGNDLKIPYSDSDRASNSWFGNAYGTVTVFCEDGEGNNHTFSSTTMNQKAKVFFPPAVGVDGQAPSQDNPPCWYVFWRQVASNGQRPVPGLEDFEYKHMNSYGESYIEKDSFLWFDTVILRVGIPAGGTHYPAGLLVNGIEFGGATGIDCCREVVEHEKQHNVYSLAIQEGAADTDPAVAGFNWVGDFLPDSGEAALGCVVGNKDTFNLAGRKAPEYGGYGDGEYGVMVHARGQTGNAAADWSKGGKQW